MTFRILADVAVVVHNELAPTDREWDAWVYAYEKQGLEKRLPFFVVTLGGGPNAAQRDRLNGVVAKVKPRVAVLTESRFVRGILTAIQWLGSMDIKGFSLNGSLPALQFLQLPATRLEEIERTVEELRGELDSVTPARAG